MYEQVVEETNVPSVNVNPSNQTSCEVRQNRIPLDHSGKGGKDNSKNQSCEREEDPVEETDEKKKRKKRRR